MVREIDMTETYPNLIINGDAAGRKHRIFSKAYREAWPTLRRSGKAFLRK